MNLMIGKRRNFKSPNCLSADFGIISEDVVINRNFSAVSSSNDIDSPATTTNKKKIPKSVQSKFDKPLTEKQIKIREYRRKRILNEDDDPFGIVGDSAFENTIPTVPSSI
jgi:hypothetical protein